MLHANNLDSMTKKNLIIKKKNVTMKIIFCKRNGHMSLISSRKDGGDLACAV